MLIRNMGVESGAGRGQEQMDALTNGAYDGTSHSHRTSPSDIDIDADRNLSNPVSLSELHVLPCTQVYRFSRAQGVMI